VQHLAQEAPWQGKACQHPIDSDKVLRLRMLLQSPKACEINHHEMTSPLASPTHCLDVQEADSTTCRLHVSGAVLNEMPYFQARLSERWAEAKEPMYLRLPQGCTTEALALLLERLHFPSGKLARVNLGLALQMVQLATMFLAERDGLLGELTQLLRESIYSPGDAELVVAFCARFEAPPCVARLAASLGRRRFSAMLQDDQLTALLRNVLITGDAAAVEAMQHVVRQRSSSGADATIACANLLRQLLQRGAAPGKDTLPSAGFLTYVHKEYQEPDSDEEDEHDNVSERVTMEERANQGLDKVLELVAEFVFAHPLYFLLLAPLMFPEIGLCSRCAYNLPLRNTLKAALMRLFDRCYQRGSGEVPGEELKGLIAALVANGHGRLLGNRASILTFEPESNASFVRLLARAPLSAKAPICEALCALGSEALCSVLTADLLRDLCNPLRQQLCLAVVSDIHDLPEDIKPLVLAELSADESSEEVGPPRPAKRLRMP